MTRTYGRLQSVEHRQAYLIWCTRFDEPAQEEPALTLAQLDRTTPDTADARRLLNTVLDDMRPERYAEILVARAEGMTLDEVGCALGITRERVRQLEKRAVQKARQALANFGVRCTADVI